MEIAFTKNSNEVIRIQIGRHTPYSSSVYFITIIKETYVNRELSYAKLIKGFFRK